MKNIFLFSILCLSFSSHAGLKTCKVYKTWLEGKTGNEICSLNKGSFCSTVKNKGQGICYGANGSFCSTVDNIGQGICYAENGSFCSTVDNIAQGICEALGKSFCSTLKDDKEKEMVKELKSACNIPPTYPNIYD